VHFDVEIWQIWPLTILGFTSEWLAATFRYIMMLMVRSRSIIASEVEALDALVEYVADHMPAVELERTQLPRELLWA
jgi:hypothetical protein